MRIVAMMLAGCALSATVSAQVPDFTPKTPLIGALLHNDGAEARRLIARGDDPNESGFLGMPPLVLAILRQDLLRDAVIGSAGQLLQDLRGIVEAVDGLRLGAGGHTLRRRTAGLRAVVPLRAAHHRQQT